MNTDRNIFTQEEITSLMEEAFAQAELALEAVEVPIGAIVINKEKVIIGRGHNKVMTRKTQAAHAEIIALESAGQAQGDWRLEECWLFVTLEPCAMCMNMAILSRIAGIVYGASSPLFGYSTVNFLDNNNDFLVYKRDVPMVISGIEAQRSVDILQKFFKKKRRGSGSS